MKEQAAKWEQVLRARQLHHHEGRLLHGKRKYIFQLAQNKYAIVRIYKNSLFPKYNKVGCFTWADWAADIGKVDGVLAVNPARS